MKGHAGSVNSIAIDPESNILASGSDDKTICLWNLNTGKHIFTFFGLSKPISCVAFNPRIPLLVSGGLDRAITTWNLETNTMRSLYSDAGSSYSHLDFIFSAAFTSNGEILATGSADKTIKIWDIPRWVSTRTLKGHLDTIWSIAIGSNDQILVSGSADKTIRIWRLNSWDEPRILTGHSNWVTSVAISPNGKLLASGSGDTTIKLWSLDTGKLLSTFAKHRNAVWSIAFSPDGEILASGGKDGVKLWNLRTGQLLQELSGRHPVAFSLDGKTLVTGSDNDRIEVWRQSVPVPKTIHKPVLSGQWWEVLGVDKLANPDEVKRRYRRLIKQYHPDLNHAAEAKEIMQAINEAYAKFEQTNS